MKKLKFVLTCFLLALSCNLFAQSLQVRGTVSDGFGDPVAGAFVVVTGTTNGTTTGVSGEFVLSNVPKDATLTISFLGMKTAIVTVGNGVVNVTLEDETELLDAVVVTAQGLTRKQKAIGYSAQTLNQEQITATHSSDLGNSLAGKIAGAQIWSAGGSTFNEGTIVLRGTTSYSNAAGSQPIYVVDGTIVNAQAVNMDDVESINVLKGPAATALYGSRGANGAVIVTTKKAEEGRSVIDFSHTTAIEMYYNHVGLNKLYGGGSMAAGLSAEAAKHGKDAYDYTSAAFLFGNDWGKFDLGDGTFAMDYGDDENWGPRFDDKTLVRPAISWDPTSPMYGKAEPWSFRLNLGDMARPALSNTTNIAFSKSMKDLSTRVAFTNVDRQGVLYNSKAVRRSVSIATTYKPAKWLTADMSYRYRYHRNENGAAEGYSAAGNVMCDFTQWGQTNVDISYYKDYLRPDGSWRTWNIVSPDNLAANYHDNPYGTLDNFNRHTTQNFHMLAGDVYASLPFNFRLGVRMNDYIRDIRYEAKYGAGSTAFDPYFRTYQSQANDLTAQAYLMWHGQAADNRLTIEAAAFAEARSYDYFYLNGATSGGLTIDGFYNLSGSVGSASANNEEEHFKTRSLFGTATIGWDDLVYLDGSLRYDVDSRLNPDNNGYLYGGGSLSLMLSKLIDAPWLNFWKLRGSVAQVGSTLSAYNIYPTYTVPSDKTQGQTSMYEPNTQVNPNIKPTISTSYEIGTEFKLFNNRFFGDVNLYRKDTRNSIISANTLAQTGYSFRTMNAGLVRNQGIEVQLGGSPVRTRDFEWSLSANIARNVNTLIELTPDQHDYTIYWTRFYYAWYNKAIEGQPIGVISSAARWARTEDGTPILQAGNATWGDVRPVYDLNREEAVGNVQPKFTGGFNTDIRFKGISLHASLDYMVGGSMVSWTNMWGTGSGILASTAKINERGVNEREPVPCGGGVYMEGVDKDGNPMSGYVDAYQYYHYKAYYDCDSWVFDRSYVKLREVSLRYELPKKFISSLGIGLTRASIAFVANNPWLIYSSIPNVDPSEVVGTEYYYLEGGQAMSTRTFGATINLTF